MNAESQQLVELHLVVEDDETLHQTGTDERVMIARAQWLALLHVGKWVAVRTNPSDVNSTLYAVQLDERVGSRARN